MHACTPTTESWRAPRQAPIRRANPLRRTMSRADAILGALKACRGGCARRMRCLRATTRGPRRRSAQGHAADAAAAREPARRRTRLPRRPSAPAAHSAPAQVIRAGALSSCAGRPHRQRTRLPAPDRPHRRPQLSARSPSPASSAQRQAALTGGVLSRVRRRCRRSASRRAAGVWLCAAHLRPFAVCAACLHSRRLCT